MCKVWFYVFFAWMDQLYFKYMFVCYLIIKMLLIYPNVIINISISNCSSSLLVDVAAIVGVFCSCCCCWCFCFLFLLVVVWCCFLLLMVWCWFLVVGWYCYVFFCIFAVFTADNIETIEIFSFMVSTSEFMVWFSRYVIVFSYYFLFIC